jgi:hypothetical protein
MFIKKTAGIYKKEVVVKVLWLTRGNSMIAPALLDKLFKLLIICYTESHRKNTELYRERIT